MYNTNDLLARIQAGENPEDIANEFAKQLNDVIEQDRKQKAAELALQKEKEEKAAHEKALDAKAQAILDAIMDYVQEAKPELAAELDDEDYGVEEIRGIIDAALAGISMSLSIAKQFSKPESAPKSNDADAIITKFLKSFVD